MKAAFLISVFSIVLISCGTQTTESTTNTNSSPTSSATSESTQQPSSNLSFNLAKLSRQITSNTALLNN
jgi:hypothetical protein